MHWRDLAESGFPEPHNEEPADLRRDIADEIADHLACAMQHELLRADELTAEQNVLARFGNPAHVARQLWFAAMKEKIMKDRVMLAFIGIMAVAALTAAVFSWSAMSESRRMNEALLASLEKLSEQANPTNNWSTVHIQLVQEDTGEPVSGQTIVISGYPFSDQYLMLDEITDSEGHVSFGPIRAGVYQGHIRLSSTGSTQHRAQFGPVELYPGNELELQMRVPTYNTAPVSFELDWGDGEAPESYVAQLRLNPVERSVKLGESVWRMPSRWLALNSEDELYIDGNKTTITHTSAGKPDATLAWSEIQPTRAMLTREYRLSEINFFAILEDQASQDKHLRLFEISSLNEPVSVFTPVAGQTKHVLIEIPAEFREQIKQDLAKVRSDAAAAKTPVESITAAQ